MSLLNIPFGDEADAIVVNAREIQYQQHLANLDAAYQQWADLEHHLSTARMTVEETRAALAGRVQALTAIIAEAEAASAYAPCTCRATARPSAEGGDPR